MSVLVVCDSGLGGLDIAANLMRNPTPGPVWDLVFLNAYPQHGRGFNDLPDSRTRQEVLRCVFEGMRKFAPDQCLLACNTLSVLHEQLRAWYEPPFPVTGILDCTTSLLVQYLRQNPDAKLLLLGTITTISSGLYQQRLVQNGIPSAQVASLPCPGLATLIEQNPLAPALRQAIAAIARQARELFADLPAELGIAFCCTHFGYATAFWQEEFARQFSCHLEFLNPNQDLTCPGNIASFRYVSRTALNPGQAEAMSPLFTDDAAPIAKALQHAVADESLFSLPPSF
ncbi:MAG: aspartate/glutamate racemase family protein [Victivallales bacterium]|nr:aspartate/glutamate racemase family protein [Victivallales bacterium]